MKIIKKQYVQEAQNNSHFRKWHTLTLDKMLHTELVRETFWSKAYNEISFARREMPKISDKALAEFQKNFPYVKSAGINTGERYGVQNTY